MLARNPSLRLDAGTSRGAGVKLNKPGQVAGKLVAREVSAALDFNRKFVGDISRPTLAGLECYDPHRIMILAGAEVPQDRLAVRGGRPHFRRA
jgi:hypothetical protein